MGGLDSLFQLGQAAPTNLVERLLLGLLVAFAVGQLNAWVYKWSHRGVSYSRSFTQALVLITIVSALSMALVVTNVLAVFGLLGGLAIIRFRTVVRDARDTAYVFLCLICGLAAGFGFYIASIIGAIVANLTALYLHKTEFGSWHRVDNLLRFEVAASALRSAAVDTVLSRFCRQHAVISVDDLPTLEPSAPANCECSYRVRLRDPDQGLELVSALKEATQARAVHLLVEQGNEDVA